MLDASIPVALPTRDTLLGFYAPGKAASAPRIMLGSILGVENLELASQLGSAPAMGRVA
jgi:hypothetical protein